MCQRTKSVCLSCDAKVVYMRATAIEQIIIYCKFVKRTIDKVALKICQNIWNDSCHIIVELCSSLYVNSIVHYVSFRWNWTLHMRSFCSAHGIYGMLENLETQWNRVVETPNRISAICFRQKFIHYVVRRTRASSWRSNNWPTGAIHCDLPLSFSFGHCLRMHCCESVQLGYVPTLYMWYYIVVSNCVNAAVLDHWKARGWQKEYINYIGLGMLP